MAESGPPQPPSDEAEQIADETSAPAFKRIAVISGLVGGQTTQDEATFDPSTEAEPTREQLLPIIHVSPELDK